jgi:predicted PurR-regulated permease PerM
MSETQRDILSSCFSLAIILFAAFVTQRFFLPLVWAAILCIATWPMLARILRSCGGHAIPAAIIATAISAMMLIVPLAIGIGEAAHQAPALAALVADASCRTARSGACTAPAKCCAISARTCCIA